MAERIKFTPEPVDTRAILSAKLAAAPDKHAEALLELFEIAQLMHDKGLIQIIRGVLDAGAPLLNVVTELLEQDDTITLLRNSAILLKTFAAINPETLEDIQHALLVASNGSQKQKSRGFFAAIRQLFGINIRKLAVTMLHVADCLGGHLQNGTVLSDSVRGKSRKKTNRHMA